MANDEVKGNLSNPVKIVANGIGFLFPFQLRCELTQKV